MELNSRLIQLVSIASHIDRIGKALYWFAGLLQLLFILICQVISEYLPVIAKYAGRYAGKFYRFLNRQEVQVILSGTDYYASQFVSQQLGTAYPTIKRAIAPVAFIPNETEYFTTETDSLTRRELLAIAKAIKLSGYSRMDTIALREAIATHR